jgi:hypothetical protein
MKKLVIIGCARSGTKYSSMLFRQLGLEIGHEEEGRDGISDWHKTIEPLNFYYQNIYYGYKI